MAIDFPRWGETNKRCKLRNYKKQHDKWPSKKYKNSLVLKNIYKLCFTIHFVVESFSMLGFECRPELLNAFDR